MADQTNTPAQDYISPPPVRAKPAIGFGFRPAPADVEAWKAQQVLPAAGTPLPNLTTPARQVSGMSAPGRTSSPDIGVPTVPSQLTPTRFGMANPTILGSGRTQGGAPVAADRAAGPGLTPEALQTAFNAPAAAPARPSPQPVSINQLRALSALLPRQPQPAEFAQRDLLSQVTAQRQAMIDAAGGDPQKLAMAYAESKSSLERLLGTFANPYGTGLVSGEFTGGMPPQ
jgi:hypothetical protein